MNFDFKRINDGPDIVYELFDKEFGLWVIELLLNASTPDPPDSSVAGYVGSIRLRELNKSETGIIVEIPREFPRELYSLGIETVKNFRIRQTQRRIAVLQFYLAALASDAIFQTLPTRTNAVALGMTGREFADVKYPNINRLFPYTGKGFRDGWLRLSDKDKEQWEKMVTMIKEGNLQFQIANKLGITQSTISKRLKAKDRLSLGLTMQDIRRHLS